MNKFRLFFSHRTSEKARVRELQDSLAELLPNFPFEDASEEVPYVDDWKTPATTILESCAGVVCFVGEDSHKSEPVDWEIREAHRLGKPLVVALLSDGYQLPPACKELQIEVARWNANGVAGLISELLVPRALFLSHDWNKGAPEPAAIGNQYNLMVQSWEALIGRRQTVITMYISVISALLAGIGVLISSVDKLGHGWTMAGIAVLALLGAALSFNWRRTVSSYGTLSRAKSKVVAALEAYMPARLFDTEWRVLEAKRYTSTTETDRQTALFFLLLFFAVFFVAAAIAAGQLFRR
jgi:hypothetical protein